jgi:heptose I phosphotransferase
MEAAIRSSRHAQSAVRPAARAAGNINERAHEASATLFFVADGCRGILENAALAEFDDVMNTTDGVCLRVLAERENWYLKTSAPSSHLPITPSPHHPISSSLGMYLKKHRTLSWRTRLAAALKTAPPPSPGRVEAENALALQALGIDVMPLTAYGEKLHADGRLESFLLSEELEGYCELQDFILRRFSPAERGSPALWRLIVQVAGIARRFHAAGFNHRDFYCCHFLVKETSPGSCDVRLIDLQRVQRRRWLRRRWIVKDLAQLASMSPEDRIGCREKVLFLRTYLGVRRLRPQDKRLVRDVLRKLSLIRRRARNTP